MPTLLKISNDLAKTFVKSKNKAYAAKRIASEINCLQHSHSKEPLDNETKVVVLQVVNELISGIRPIELLDGEVFSISPNDVSSFSKLSSKMLEMIAPKPQYAEKNMHVEFKKQSTTFHIFSLNFHSVTASVSEIGKYFKARK